MKSFILGRRGVFAVACLLGLWACGDDDKGASPKPDGGLNNMDSGMPAPGGNMDMDAAPGASMDSGTPTVTPTPPLMCGGETCTIAAGAAMLGTTACCTTDDACGGLSPLSPDCLPLGAIGSYDETCPDFTLTAGFPLTFGGCCTVDGECGALDSSEGGFGCIPAGALQPTDGGGAGQICTYDPTATCTSILVAFCDGPEDCSGGQQCCGQFAGGGYSMFTCEDSCVELAAMGGIWSEACHPGETCTQPILTDAGMPPVAVPDGGVIAYECRMNTMYLPDFLFRCRDTGDEPAAAGSTASGEVNCGDGVCGTGEKCCYALGGAATGDAGTGADNGVAHCVASDTPCTCAPGADNDGG